jgi:hypothetical protein
MDIAEFYRGTNSIPDQIVSYFYSPKCTVPHHPPQQFQGLKMTYQNEETLKNILDGCDHTAPFSDGWNDIQS